MIEHRKLFEIEKKFKKDFGMTLNQAININKDRIKASNEIYHLKCLLNGLDTTTGLAADLSPEDRMIVLDRLEEIEV